MSTLKIYKLTCNTTEDNMGADHVYIKVGGKRVWGPYRINDDESLDVGVRRSFDDQIAIELWDEDDIDGDDLLGRRVVQGIDGPRKLKFNNDESDYDLTCETWF